MFGARPHSSDVDAEADQADDEHAPPAVVVGQRAGQDEQRAERQQVAVLDVVLALEHVDEEARLLADRGQRDGQHGRVEEDDARAEHGGDQRPALACVRHRALAATSAAILQSAAWHQS